MASVVWQAFQQSRETGEVRPFRSNDRAVVEGGQRRDFVSVEDCIDHMLWLWRQQVASGIYNSGTGTARTFADLAEPAIRFIDMPANLARQYQNLTRPT